MGASKHGEISRDLARAAARFAAWRGATRLGARIPHALWRLAVELAGRHGVSRTSAALKLDYYALKKRLLAASAAKDVKAEVTQPPTDASAPRPAFVELAAAPFAMAAECLIEFESASGAKMRVHLKGREMPDLAMLGAALGRDFWEAG
jgi:hypothetical protein